MRLGGPLSFVLHFGFLVAGVIVAPQVLKDTPAPMRELPVELLTIADSTNVAPIYEDMKTDEVAEEALAPEASSSEAAAAAAPETAEILPTEKTPEPKKEEKPAEKEVKAPEKPTPKKAEEDGMDSFLKTIQKNKTKAPTAGKTANDPTKVADAGAARAGAGDNNRMTITIADAIRSQLMERGCWADQEDMADSQRLRAVIRVKFERNGKMAGAPELIEPARQSASDGPMNIFIGRAFRALHQCEPFQVPAEYFKVTPARWIDLTFVP